MGDLIIVGAGLAGLSAAITSAKMGLNSILISDQSSERAQSVLAEGGINAVLDTMEEKDSIQEHYRDSLEGGSCLADPDALYAMVKAAPSIWKRKIPGCAPASRPAAWACWNPR